MPLTTGAICFTLPLVTTWRHGVVALTGLEFALYGPPDIKIPGQMPGPTEIKDNKRKYESQVLFGR
jgi:hypothetical protein